MKVVIMAGGRGTRIAPMTNDIPKPMIKINGKPVLEHEIECLRHQGFTDLIITVSYLGSVIMDYFGNGNNLSPVTGKSFGVEIMYYIEKQPLGNAGALFQMKDKLTEDFLLLNADSVFDIDFKRFIDYHKEKGGMVTLFTHPNSHPYDSSLISTNKENQVIKWFSKDEKLVTFYKNRVNAGLHVISPQLLTQEFDTPQVDLDRQLLKPLAGTGKMYAYDSSEYVKDMGTLERYKDVCKDYTNGIVKMKNLKNKQKAVFIDRDGTINIYKGFLKDIDEFQLLEGVGKAIRKINQSGYLAIIVTNQPVIARGEVSWEELEKIHDKMETLLGEEGAYVDGIYLCPHHPDKGFEGERRKYKMICACRKPKPGMLFNAARDFNIDLSQSWMIGDDENDIKAGKAAGCKTALIGKRDYGQNLTVESLLDFMSKSNFLENENF